MLTRQSKKIGDQINHMGLLQYLLNKITEQWYKLKFSSLGIKYPAVRNDLSVVNSCSVNKDARFNDSSAYYIIHKGFASTGLQSEDINLLDIGCGYGKVLNFGMLKKFNRVIGIDLDTICLKNAERHCRQMYQRGYQIDFGLHQQDACQYKIPPGTNVIYLANPFGKKTMISLVENIMRYYYRHKEELYIIYAIAVHKEIFEEYHECKILYQLTHKDSRVPALMVFKIDEQNVFTASGVSFAKHPALN